MCLFTYYDDCIIIIIIIIINAPQLGFVYLQLDSFRLLSYFHEYW